MIKIKKFPIAEKFFGFAEKTEKFLQIMFISIKKFFGTKIAKKSFKF
jgi:hypothetical protein